MRALGRSLTLGVAPLLVGRHESADLHVDDPEVSALHCELRAVKEGILVRDLGSANGTLLGGVALREAVVRSDARLLVGSTPLDLEPAREAKRVELGDRDTFGDLYGNAPEMRHALAVLERAAATDLSVLVLGETGTGKELAARALHDGSSRRAGPFVVVDCGALPAGLAEGLLFGHEKGAFTDATTARVGLLASAHGGTVFLDELGELPLDLQPKLLRALAEREIVPVGATKAQKIDVRVVAATRRDLAQLMNAQRFRSDLYFRLAQVRVELPPLRRRLSDVPELVRRTAARLGRASAAEHCIAFIEARMHTHDWPGNVRELVNVVSIAASFDGDGELADAVLAVERSAERRGPLSAFAGAKRLAVAEFERRYFEALVGETAGNVTEMAKRSGMERHHVRAFLRKYGLGRGA